jgi:hypothetical protein
LQESRRTFAAVNQNNRNQHSKNMGLTHKKFSRKFCAKVPQSEIKSPTVEENFLENFSRLSPIQE